MLIIIGVVLHTITSIILVPPDYITIFQDLLHHLVRQPAL